MSIIRETIVERRQAVLRWSAVFAGALVGVGLWILLQVLGTGIGLSTIDSFDQGELRRAGIGTGIWSAVAPLIALFLGGMVAARISDTRDRGYGALHGVVLWSLIATTLFIAILAGGISGMQHAVNQDMMRGDTSAVITTRDTHAAADFLLWTGAALGLGLAAAALGGAVGARRRPSTTINRGSGVRVVRSDVTADLSDVETTPVRGVPVPPPPTEPRDY